MKGDGGIGEEKERGERLNIGGEMRIGGFESQMQDPQTERKEAFFYYICCGPEASVKEEIRSFSNVRRSFLWVHISF